MIGRIQTVQFLDLETQLKQSGEWLCNAIGLKYSHHIFILSENIKPTPHTGSYKFSHTLHHVHVIASSFD